MRKVGLEVLILFSILAFVSFRSDCIESVEGGHLDRNDTVNNSDVSEDGRVKEYNEKQLKHGPPGVTGNRGATGATGANGAIGTAGIAGATGARGATGATGSAGPAGTSGATGATGGSNILSSSYGYFTATNTNAVAAGGSFIFDQSSVTGGVAYNTLTGVISVTNSGIGYYLFEYGASLPMNSVSNPSSIAISLGGTGAGVILASELDSYNQLQVGEMISGSIIVPLTNGATCAMINISPNSISPANPFGATGPSVTTYYLQAVQLQ